MGRIMALLRRGGFGCAPHPGENTINYDMNSEACPFLKPGDIWYIVAAAGFCGLVLLVLAIVWIRSWSKKRAKARRLQEPNPANERMLEGLNSPLMDGAAAPGMADSFHYEEKDPYVFDEEQRYRAHRVTLDPSQEPSYYHEHPNLSNPDLFGPPVPLLHHSSSQLSLHPVEQDIAAARFSQQSNNPYSSPYAEHVPLPSSHDHSDYEYEYNSSSQDHQLLSGMGPAQLRVNIPPSQSYFSTRSPSEYATPEAYRSPEGDYHLVTPTYPDPGMRRQARSPPGVVDSYTSIPAGVSSGRTSIIPQINGSLPEYPAAARSPIKSPVRSARSERSETSSQARWLARYGRTPPVPERPMGLAHYASGLGSHEDHEPEEDYADGRTFGRGGSSDDHSLGLLGSQSQHMIDDGYLYDVPTVAAPTQPMSPWRARRTYG